MLNINRIIIFGNKNKSMVSKVEIELDALKKETLEMWTLVYNQLQRAGESVLTLNKDLARQVILREKRVNAFELKIDSDVEDIIALYNPVAVQLRFVLAVLKTNTNLERLGDFAEGIARFVLRTDNNSVNTELFEELRLHEMVERVLLMLEISKKSFNEENIDDAMSLISKDNLVDEINAQASTVLTQYIANHIDETKMCLDLVGVFRKLERSGDHITNIGEEIVFYIEAKVLKHHDKHDETDD